MKNINDISNIDTTTIEGQLLLSALSIITLEVHPDQVPEYSIRRLNDINESVNELKG